jgi:hypothetical protein
LKVLGDAGEMLPVVVRAQKNHVEMYVKRSQASTVTTMIKDARAKIQKDLPGKSSHLKNVGSIIMNTGITTKDQLISARVRTRNSEKRFVFELVEDFSNRSAVANATEMAPAVAVINPSSKKVPSDRDVKARAEAGASKKKAGFFEFCGNTTSHTAANAYPMTEISNAQVKAWLVQSNRSLKLESFPNPTEDPEFNMAATTWGSTGEPISIISRWPFLANA